METNSKTKAAKTSKTTKAKATPKKAASKASEQPTGKSDKKSSTAKVEETKEVLEGFAGKKRGHFNHPEGIKAGDDVSFKVKNSKGNISTVKGTFLFCNRNSVEYGVIEHNGTRYERSLKKFQKA
jgi:hypothetical protein